jgi:NAD(P)-dependent dehydrogenase (short-subunit alcohol dehydrogenase family)
MSDLSKERPFVLVTGAARRLGRAIALGMAKEGYAIGLHYHHSEDDAQHTAAEIRALGVPVTLLKADLAEPGQIESIFGQIERVQGKLDVLINSAAMMTRGNLRQLDVGSWDATMALNLRAPWLCAQQAARLMQSSGGVIINISDSGARKTWTGYAAYIISKAGVEILTQLLARTLAPEIRVNAVAPGLILPPDHLPAEEWQRLVKRLPAQKAGDPDDIVSAVLFLIRNHYLTGQILVVDGGYQLI